MKNVYEVLRQKELEVSRGEVLAVTYKDVEGCETPVRTRKDKG